MTMVQVPIETLNKAAGFVETVKVLFDKQAQEKKSVRTVAEKVAKELAAGGFMPEEKVASLTETLSNDPSKGFEIVSKLAAEVKASRTKLAEVEKKAAEVVPSLGVADSSKPQRTAKKASDEAWERGFQV
jgi:hypothetical protein